MQITKQRIKQLLLLMTTCFFIAISFTSCEKDLYEDAIKNSSRDLTVTHVSLSGLDKTTSSKINEKITLLKNLSKKTSSQGWFEYNSALDIYIDAENGRLVNNNGKLYYTFPMFRKTEENLENIIFAPLASGEMETYFAKYNVTPDVFDDLTITEIENLNPTIQRIDANSFEYTCVTISWTVTTYPGCNYQDGMHSNGQQCDAAVVAFSMEFCSVSLGGGGVFGDGNSSTSNTGSNNSGPIGSGGASSASGISTSPTNMSEADQKKKKFMMQLTGEQSQCLDELPDDVEETLLGLLNVQLVEDCDGNTITEEQQFETAEEQLSSLCGSNSEEAIAQFQNWFSTPREGKDGNYDTTFWENPNLTFPQQNLPSFSDFDTAYPRIDGEQLAQLVGGDVLQLYTQYPNVVRGFCALKVSRALNYSGVTIPNIVTTNNIPGTVLGNDGKYYFLNAKALNKWMQKTFGTGLLNPNHLRIRGCDGGSNGINFPSLTSGLKGIYSMVSTNPQWASGHADLINEGVCVFGCHFFDTPPAPIDYIDIWILN